MFDFLVIGGGIAGAAIGYFLSEDSHVCLVEQEAFPGLHSTGRSAAVYHEPYGNAAVRALTRSSRGMLEDPPFDFLEAPLLTPRGCLYLAREEQLAALATVAQACPEIARVPPQELTLRVPILKSGCAVAALYDPSMKDVDVHALHQGFLKVARHRGLDLRTNCAVRAMRHVNGSWQLDTGLGRLDCKTVINAAGAWAEEIAGMAGRPAPVGLRPLRRTAVLIDAPAGVAVRDWPFVVDVEEKYYFKPDAGLILVSPAEETRSTACDAQPDDLDVAIGVDHLERVTTITVRRVRKAWTGLRTFVADRSPVIGYDDLLPDFFWLAALGGYGIQTAPAAGRLAARLARREPLDTIPGSTILTASLAPSRASCGAWPEPSAVQHYDA